MSRWLPRRFPWGMTLMGLSVLSRIVVLAILAGIALNTAYINLKVGYNNARLVELSSGPRAQAAYAWADRFYGQFGDPLEVAQRSGGMTWSIRLFGLPFTDPIAALTVLTHGQGLSTGMLLGLAIPLLLALCCGRVFCAWICPASLPFFAITRVRRLLRRFLYLPEFRLNRGVAWGVLAGGLLAAWLFGQGIWVFVLPYLGLGNAIFQGIAFGVLAAGLGGVVFCALVDLCLGSQFTCRYLCPTGRLLGAIGRRAPLRVRRRAADCQEACTSCTALCPLGANPKVDDQRDCSLCGECMIFCPTRCLAPGVRPR